MGYLVTLDVGNRYTGCKELVPGMVYTDNKGEELLFVGYSYICRDEGTQYEWGGFTSFIYAKVKQLHSKMLKDYLSQDMHDYFGGDIRAFGLFYTSQNPRILKKAEYQMFPSDYFEDFKITQHYGGFDSETVIRTKPLVDPYVCKVEKV